MSPLNSWRSRVCSRLDIRLLAGISLLATPLIAQAHEYWIEADNYAPAPGDRVALSTRVGQYFAGDEVLNIKDFYSDYSVNSIQGRIPVSGSLATTPPAYIDVADNGTYIVGQRTLRSQVEMNPKKFSEYLKKQGLLDTLQAVDYSKSDEDPIVEDYSRCAKAIIQSSEQGSTSILSTPLGYTLELIPYSNPIQSSAGEVFRVQLLYKGSAMANAQITSLNKNHPESPIKTRTDSDGYSDITLPYAGIWMMSSVHIIPAENTDWESFWANLTFQIPD